MRGNADTTRTGGRGRKKLMKCSSNRAASRGRSIATERNRKEETGREVEDGNVSRDQSRYYDGAAREMSSPFAQEVRTKGSILSSLSRNDPIQPLDFTLRSRYETISISFAEGPSGTEDFFDISRRFGILYGPLYLNPSALPPHPLVRSCSPSLFTPRSTHIAPIESRGTGAPAAR